MKQFTIVLSLIALMLALGCWNDTSTGPAAGETTSSNPNGDSELALLMREIHEDAKVLRQKVVTQDDNIGDYPDYLAQLPTATPTKPEVSGELYNRHSSRYQKAMTGLYRSFDKSNYNHVISTCLHCHQEFCPGPIPTIKKLILD